MYRYSFLALAIVLSACGSDEKTYKVEDGNGSTATISTSGNDEVARIQTEDGSVVIKQGGKDVIFPSYAPQYPGSTVLTSMNYNTGREGSGANITLKTSDEVTKVISFYKKAITNAGMTVMMETNTPDSSMLVAGHSGKPAGVTISANRSDDGQTTVNLTSGDQK